MALHGHAILETRDAKRGYIMQRVEHDNVISPWVYDAITKGDFSSMIHRNKIMPLATNWFGGCILTDKPNPNDDDVSGFFGLIGSDAEIIATAGNDAYTGSNAKRGSADNTTGMTGPMANGYRFVWRWNESHGNGRIESVCLTRPEIAKAHIKQSGNLDYEDDVTLPVCYANESLSNGTLLMSQDLMNLQVIDYDKEIGYKFTVTPPEQSASIPYGGTMLIEKYSLNTRRLHLSGNSLGIIRKIDEHSVDVKVPYNFRYTYSTVIYTGDKFVFCYLPGEHGFTDANHGLLNVTIIDIATYGVSHYIRDYNSDSSPDNQLGYIRSFFTSANNQFDMVVDGFGFEYQGNTPYIYAVTSKKPTDQADYEDMNISVLGLDSDANFDTVEKNWWGIKTGYAYNGPWITLPNGDRYIKERATTHAMYYHNGVWYRTTMVDYHEQGNSLQGITGNIYGTNIFKNFSNRPAEANWTCSLDALFPWVSTVNNLSDPITKNITQTMSLVYEITET
jgi:hypothetical protein